MTLAEEQIETFRGSMRGRVLTESDSGYDEARQIWNGMFDKRPGLIARCVSAGDVIAAVNYARDNNLLIAVRGGGHSFPGYSVCEGGMMIDLSPMRSIRVDPESKTARAEPGVLWAEIDREAEVFGLATPGGMISHTGIAGLTLGGGFGWLCRKHGLVVDNLLSCDVVLADGRLVRASADENADLFWGLRGGGGNFGIVTSFEYRLHDLGPILGGMLAFPLPEATKVIPAYAALMEKAPDYFIAGCFILTTPDGHQAVGIAPAYLGNDMAEGERLIAPLKQLGTLVMDAVGPMPYTQIQKLIDGAAVPHRRYYMRSNFIGELSEAAATAMVEAYTSSPSPLSAFIIVPFGGAVARVPADATAFYYRSAPYSMTLLGAWEDSAADEANIAWLRNGWDRLQPFLADGVYVNELFDEGAERIKSAYGPTFGRLQDLKRKYDPNNLFRMNQNIAP
ncbi:MAG TPA: FAD-binding oxidoreductase [Dehalococcoidia bacterium]|nr:FAD-binding oxidoreductase [Dehalococcoidia bacterium]